MANCPNCNRTTSRARTLCSVCQPLTPEQIQQGIAEVQAGWKKLPGFYAPTDESEKEFRRSQISLEEAADESVDFR